MRKIVIYCLLVSGVLSVMSCQGMSADDVTAASGPATFTATIAYSSSTKTTLSGSPGSSRKVYWSNGDKVVIGGAEYMDIMTADVFGGSNTPQQEYRPAGEGKEGQQ